MRSRLLTIYSEEEFKEQLNESSHQCFKDNESSHSISSNSTSLSDTEKEDEYNEINNINRCYNQNVLDEELTTKLIKQIILKKQCVLFSKTRRDSVNKNVDFRQLIHCAIENNIETNAKNNTLSLCGINIFLSSNIECIDINLKNKFVNELMLFADAGKKRRNSRSRRCINIKQKALNQPFSIHSNQVIVENKLVKLRLFDVCNFSEVLPVYAVLSQVLIFLFSGGDEEKCVELLKTYTQNSSYSNKLIIVIESDPFTDEIKNFCQNNFIKYYDHIPNPKNILHNVLFLKKQLRIKNKNTEVTQNEIDALKQGMDYHIDESFEEHYKEKNYSF